MYLFTCEFENLILDTAASGNFNYSFINLFYKEGASLKIRMFWLLTGSLTMSLKLLKKISRGAND